jgi:hypothetical protein
MSLKMKSGEHHVMGRRQGGAMRREAASIENAMSGERRPLHGIPGRPSSPIVWAILGALLALAPLGLFAVDESAHRRPIVLVLVHGSNPGESAPLGTLIFDSFSAELASLGIAVVPSDAAAVDDRTIASLAEKSHADFGLWGMYTLDGSEIRVDARWIDPAKGVAVRSASRTGALNLSFDDVVAGLVDEIVESQRWRFATLSPELNDEMPSIPAAAPPAPMSSAVIDRGIPMLPTASAARAETPIAPIAFSAGSAPFIATFSALNYFPVGLNVSFTGQYRISTPGGLFGFGISSGISGFHGKGAYAEADFYVVPIGFDVLYGTQTGSAIDFFMHLGGGPAIFMARLASGDSLAKVIPYLAGGVGVLWSLFDGLGIAVEAGYECFFDTPSPIMGFAPSISVLVKL